MMKRVGLFLLGLALLSAAPPSTVANDRVWILWSQDDTFRGQLNTAHDAFPTLEACHTARAQEQARRQEEAQQDAARRQAAAPPPAAARRQAASPPPVEAPWRDPLVFVCLPETINLKCGTPQQQ